MPGVDDILGPPPKPKVDDLLGPNPDAHQFEPHNVFQAQMDQTFGAGRWRTTGGYRSPGREDQLRAQGAQTVVPGHTSKHSQGSPDAPGAYDIVVDGMTPRAAAQIMRQKGLTLPTFPEGSAGGQGAHLHVAAASSKSVPKADDLLGPPPVGALLGPAPKVGAAPGAPPAGTKPSLGDNVKEGFGAGVKDVGDAWKKVGQDFGRKGAGAFLPNAFDLLDAVGKTTAPIEKAGGYGLAGVARKTPLNIPGVKDVDALLRKAGQGFDPNNQDARRKFFSDRVGDAIGMVGGGEAKNAPKAVSAAEGALARGKGALKTAEKIASPETVKDPARMYGAQYSGVKRSRAVGQTAIDNEIARSDYVDSAKATALIHRKAFGIRGTEADAEARALAKHQRVVGNASPEDQLKIINYVESRSTEGAKIEPKYQAAADAIRDMSQRYRKRIETVLGDGKDGPKFVQDYYSRMWKNTPKEVESAVPWGAPKQGSGRSLKARTLPTYEDGLKAGLTPKYTNPLDAMTAYADNMASFLGTHDVQNEMKRMGLTKMVPEGQIPEGWVRLNGVRSEEEGAKVIKDGVVVGRQGKKVLVAPEGAARVYNNHISKGLDQGDVGPIYRGARSLVNGMVQLKLGLSTFHAATMGEEGFVSQVAKGIGEASRGRPLSAAKTIATAPLAPVTTARKGEALRGELLGYRPPTEMGSKVAKAYREAGGRVYMDRMYSAHGSGNFWGSMKRGTLSRDAGDAAKKLYTGSLVDRAKAIVDTAGNLISTTAAPIFEEYVPRMKMGAFSSRMEAYLKENPAASEKEQAQYAAKLVDTIDNRFGELQKDNLFWHKSAYQIAQMLMLSPSWNLGTAREIGGGVIEIPKSLAGIVKGKGVTDKTAYVAALVGTTMLQNGIMTYLHTGQMPEGQDFFAYRTGGKDQNGSDERAIIPGYMKDVLAFGWQFPSNVVGEIENKANPGLSAAGQLISNRDYRGDPIIRPKGVDPVDDNDNRFTEAASFIAKQMVPMSLSQKPNPDSKISALERALAIKQAPSYLEDPERVRGFEAKYGGQAWKRKLKHDAKDAQ